MTIEPKLAETCPIDDGATVGYSYDAETTPPAIRVLTTIGGTCGVGRGASNYNQQLANQDKHE